MHELLDEPVFPLMRKKCKNWDRLEEESRLRYEKQRKDEAQKEMWAKTRAIMRQFVMKGKVEENT